MVLPPMLARVQAYPHAQDAALPPVLLLPRSSPAIAPTASSACGPPRTGSNILMPVSNGAVGESPLYPSLGICTSAMSHGSGFFSARPSQCPRLPIGRHCGFTFPLPRVGLHRQQQQRTRLSFPGTRVPPAPPRHAAPPSLRASPAPMRAPSCPPALPAFRSPATSVTTALASNRC